MTTSGLGRQACAFPYSRESSFVKGLFVSPSTRIQFYSYFAFLVAFPNHRLREAREILGSRGNPLSTKVLSQEEQTCEAHFKENAQRNFEGRHIVRLPFNENKEKLGESRHMALQRFKLLEKRFERNLELKVKYCAEWTEHIFQIEIENSSS